MFTSNVPVAADDTLSAVEDTVLTGNLATNDTPSGDGGNVWALATGPANGTVTVGADGSFVTPNADYSGRTVSPTRSRTPMATSRPRLQRSTLRRRVTPRSRLTTRPPAEDTPVIIGVLGNDSDPDGDTLTITEVAGQPIGLGSPVTIPEGTVALNPDGTLSFTPNADFNGPVSFDYTVSDGTTPVSATVDITVTPVNDVPVAADDTLSAVEDTPLTGTLATNDTPSGDGGNVWAVATGPSNGTVTVGTDGSFVSPRTPTTTVRTASPTPITDADGDISTATATINVAPTSDARSPGRRPRRPKTRR